MKFDEIHIGPLTTPQHPDPAEIDAKPADRLGGRKRAVDVQAAATKRDLAQWLDQNRGTGDSAATTIALMETAFDQYLAGRTQTLSDLAPAAADANDMIQAILRRAVQRRRATLRMDMSANAPAAGDPAGDEECANRLADTLKFLDTLAVRVPDHLVSREELASAGEVLALLIGWFAGGIGEAPAATKASR
jgi:hypothetical protein